MVCGSSFQQFLFREAGDDDDRHGKLVLDCSAYGQAVHIGHLDIRDDQIRFVLSAGVEKL